MNEKIKLFQRIQKKISLLIHSFLFLFLLFLNLLSISHFFLNHENIIKYSFINYYRVVSESMEPNIKKNDIVIVRKMKEKDYSENLIGKVIIFKAEKEEPNIIIHRVKKFHEINNKKLITTLGDNNKGISHKWEEDFDSSQIIAKYCFRISMWQQLIFFLTYIFYFCFCIFWSKKNVYDEKK